MSTQATQKIIADLEKGELTWRKPWSDEFCTGQVVRPLRHNDIPYSGINTLILWAAAAEHGFNSPYWMTFRQAQEMKLYVQEGEKGVRIVYADKMIKEEEGPNGEKQKQETTFLKEYTVFNAEQIIGLPEAFYVVPEAKIINPDTRKKHRGVFSETKADIFIRQDCSIF